MDRHRGYLTRLQFLFLEILHYWKKRNQGQKKFSTLSQFIKKGYIWEMSFILLKQTFKGIAVDFFTFLDGFKELMISERDSLMLMNPRSSE